jgi:hypothetical protein
MKPGLASQRSFKAQRTLVVITEVSTLAMRWRLHRMSDKGREEVEEEVEEGVEEGVEEVEDSSCEDDAIGRASSSRRTRTRHATTAEHRFSTTDLSCSRLAPLL